MNTIPVAWWLTWMAGAAVLYIGLIWFFTREATRPRHPGEGKPGSGEDTAS